MFSFEKQLFLCILIQLFHSCSCMSEPSQPPSLVLFSPTDVEYTEVLVRRAQDQITLVCEMRGDSSPRTYVWNYIGNGTVDRVLKPSPPGSSANSTLTLRGLQVGDSGDYMCSAPPHSVTRRLLVQQTSGVSCARGAFVCGLRCVLAAYVCDGRRDCLQGEDEREDLCGPRVCQQPHKLQCSGARCISSSACCRVASPLCQQPACCDEHRRPTAADGYVEAEYPPLYEDRRAPDDYGFIQSTIYTVTACALIFMIAVVLLVSAICKMQMKRAALRGYSHNAHLQAPRFPPCYEASRLLEERGSDASTLPPHEHNALSVCSSAPCSPARGLGRLTDIFTARYTQVPTRPPDVELMPLPLPGGCEGQAEAPPPEVGANNDQGGRERLTLQLGPFQVCVPRWSRARPPTPTVARLDLLGLSDTYTLNGRTIRLLGAEFECPLGSGDTAQGVPRPPTYMEAVRYKLYGPPPQYLSREGINRRSADHVDIDAAANVEMPPCYYDLPADSSTGNASGICDQSNGNATETNGNRVTSTNNSSTSEDVDNANGNDITNDDSIANDAKNSSNDNAVAGSSSSNTNDEDNAVNNITSVGNNTDNIANDNGQNNDNAKNNGDDVFIVVDDIPNSNCDSFNGNVPNSNLETFSSIIDNLPAIDSDVNANDDAISSLGVINSTAVNNGILNSN